jgi:hypothetical protein
MPAYTILMMRKDATDRRPLTIHIGAKLFWFLLVLAISLPVAGFMISYGMIAPTWLDMNFKSMQRQVAQAAQTEEQNQTLSDSKAKLEATLADERAARATAEARVTMAETARIEASNRLAELEGEVLNLRQSVATYEVLFKPKLRREVLECVNTETALNGNQLRYTTQFAKLGREELPKNLTARVRVLVGDNALSLAGGPGGQVLAHNLNLEKSNKIEGTLTVPAAEGTRLLDIKIFTGTEQVGYCWKVV